MSALFVQKFGNSKNMIVELVHQRDKDVLLQCVKDGFVFAVSKTNFKKFYSDYDLDENYVFSPSQEEIETADINT